MTSVVEISPITRVEGHGSVRVHLEGGRTQRVELALTESPRLFEALLVGKGFAEVPEIICRICSLCSTIHKVTALEAVEKALGVRVSELTRLTRELIVNGGMIQDHALHLYCLLLPDFFALRGVSELALHAPELLRAGLGIKRVGNLIQETVGGRMIHPVNIKVGGLGRALTGDELARLKEELAAILPACRQTVQLFTPCFEFPQLPAPNYLALETPLHGGAGALITTRSGPFFEVERYRDCITETVLPYSNAKKALVFGEEPTVGALARLNVGVELEPETAELFDQVKGEVLGKDIRANNLSQAIELCQAVERSIVLIDRLRELGKTGALEVAAKPKRGSGAAACEAPRGILIHSYSFDDAGICCAADVITPTSLNQGALARDLLALARGMEGAEAPVLKTALERLIRCYDPCISCSVHLLQL